MPPSPLGERPSLPTTRLVPGTPLIWPTLSGHLARGALWVIETGWVSWLCPHSPFPAAFQRSAGLAGLSAPGARTVPGLLLCSRVGCVGSQPRARTTGVFTADWAPGAALELKPWPLCWNLRESSPPPCSPRRPALRSSSCPVGEAPLPPRLPLCPTALLLGTAPTPAGLGFPATPGPPSPAGLPGAARGRMEHVLPIPPCSRVSAEEGRGGGGSGEPGWTRVRGHRTAPSLAS